MFLFFVFASEASIYLSYMSICEGDAMPKISQKAMCWHWPLLSTSSHKAATLFVGLDSEVPSYDHLVFL